MDEAFTIIYPRVLVAFTEAPTCPRLHPHPGSSGPVKHKHRESGDMDRKGEVLLMNSEISSPLSILYLHKLLLMIEEDAQSGMFLKKPQGFSLGLLSAEFTICMADSMAK